MPGAVSGEEPGGAGNDGMTCGQRYERRQLVRSVVTASASTVVFAVVLVFVVSRQEKWPDVKQAFFNGGVFGDSFSPILHAFWLDVRIFLICAPCILVIGLLVSLARSTRSPVLFPVRALATVYVDVTRGVPVILWINLIGFGVVVLINSRSFFGGYLFWGGVTLGWDVSAVRERGVPCWY